MEMSKKMSNNSKTAKRLTASLISLIVMAVCLAITTFAIVYSMVSVDSNLFSTGSLKINLNDGVPIITEGDCLVEPGATVQREFFIENLSTDPVFYRFYFKNVTGGLADVLIVKICDGDKVLVEGKPNEITQKNVPAAEEALGIGEKKVYQISFYFPTESGNVTKNKTLEFDLAADAVQTKNNNNREFD